MNNKTAPLRRNVPLYQQAYEEIKDAILIGDLKPGEKIVESQLADHYQISRTPLREALRQLQIEGLIVADRASLKVVELDQQDFLELSQCRLVLEKEVMRQVVETITDKDIDRLQETVNRNEENLKKENVDYLEVLKYNTEFHEIINQICSNKRLIALLNQTRSFLLLYRANALINSKEIKDINEEHRAILEALKEKNIEKLINVSETHLKGDLERGIAGNFKG